MKSTSSRRARAIHRLKPVVDLIWKIAGAGEFPCPTFAARSSFSIFGRLWCAPCRASMPKVERLHKRFRARGLQVVGVNIEGMSDEVFGYIDAGGYSFLFLFDDGNWKSDVTRSYGVTSIPRSYLIDRHGQIVYSGHPDSLSEALVEASLQ